MRIPETRPGRGRSAPLFSDIISIAISSFLICYCIVSFFAGQAGILAYRDLKHTIVLMEERITVLGNDNARLAELRRSYLDDSDRIAREAREIGYLRPGEKIVILPPGVRIDAGLEGEPVLEPVRVGPSTGLPDGLVKLLSSLTGLVVLFASLVMAIAPRKKLTVRMSEDR